MTAGLIGGLTLGAAAVLGDNMTNVVMGVTVLVAGVSVPAITTAVRRSLPLLTDDPAVRSAGYAALSVAFQLAFAVGPLLVSLAVLVTGRSATALLLAAVMIVTAAVIFTCAVPAQHPARAEPVAPRPAIIPLRPLLALYGVAACTGMATGMTTVAVPAVMQAAGLVVVAGIAFGASAVGDVVGAVVFGSRRWPLSERQQLSVALLAAGCVAILVFLSSGFSGCSSSRSVSVAPSVHRSRSDCRRYSTNSPDPQHLAGPTPSWSASASSRQQPAPRWPGTSPPGWTRPAVFSAHQPSL